MPAGRVVAAKATARSPANSRKIAATFSRTDGVEAAMCAMWPTTGRWAAPGQQRLPRMRTGCANRRRLRRMVSRFHVQFICDCTTVNPFARSDSVNVATPALLCQESRTGAPFIDHFWKKVDFSQLHHAVLLPKPLNQRYPKPNNQQRVRRRRLPFRAFASICQMGSSQLS